MCFTLDNVLVSFKLSLIFILFFSQFNGLFRYIKTKTCRDFQFVFTSMVDTFPTFFFFSIRIFMTIHESQDCRGKGDGISLTPHYYFHPLHRHLDISRAITAESSPLHIGSSQTQTENLWLPSTSC